MKIVLYSPIVDNDSETGVKNEDERYVWLPKANKY